MSTPPGKRPPSGRAGKKPTRPARAPSKSEGLRADDRQRLLDRERRQQQKPATAARPAAKGPGRRNAEGKDRRSEKGPARESQRLGLHPNNRADRRERGERRLTRSERERQAPRPIREDLVTQACLEVYGAVRHEGRLADRALEFSLRRKKNLYSNERRAVAERIYALLRRQITIDHLLERARPRFEALNTTAKDLLRLCASRVLLGEEAETVAQSLHLGSEDTATLLALPDAAAEIEALPRARRFAIAGSLPDFIAERFRQEFGEDAEAEVEAMNERAPLVARVNTLKTDREALMQTLRDEGVECRPTLLSPLGIVLETRLNAFSLEAFKEGLFELQDEGSQLLGMLVDPPPTRVVDACAGAGGKTLQLSAEMANRGELFALDVEEGRLEDLRKRARRAGVHNVRVRVIPAEEAKALEVLRDLAGKADRVLVDAPCSGTGTYRRKPDARYRLTPESLQEHIARQQRLLSQFSTLVKPGGRLIYGTCSVLRAENEEVISAFLKKHPDFSVRSVSEELGEELGPRVQRDGFLRLSPRQHGTDGFFGAILVRAKA